MWRSTGVTSEEPRFLIWSVGGLLHEEVLLMLKFPLVTEVWTLSGWWRALSPFIGSITNERQNLLTGMAVNVALRCYTVHRFALHWNMLPAPFSELVVPAEEDTGVGCKDRVWGLLLSLFAYLRLVLHPFLLLSIYSPTPHPVFRILCDWVCRLNLKF
jgi:hypothetical protein